MKYKDLPIEEAREECKKHVLKKLGSTTVCDCIKCPLRRTRTDEKGKEHTLFCYWRLQELISELCEDYEEFREEEIKHYKERKEEA